MEFSFEKLNVYQEARYFNKEVYLLLKRFPAEERFALCDQLRRSVSSVPSNIAEGTSRTSLKEKIHFLEIAYSSLMESFCQLTLAFDLSYINVEELDIARFRVGSITKMLSGLKASYEKQLAPTNIP